jgi:hypothetical protein
MDNPSYDHLVVVNRNECQTKLSTWYSKRPEFAGRPWVVLNKNTGYFISPAFLTKEDAEDERAEIIVQDMFSDYDDGIYYPEEYSDVSVQKASE